MVQPPAANMLKMVWDDDLEKIASDFAAKCIVAHNPDRHKAAKRFDWVGENIAWGTGTCGDKDCGDVYEGVKRWFTENKSYEYKTGECSGKCTLYTQMAWWESNKLGCGARKCGDRTILVCNYAPGGNYVGQRPYVTGKPCSKCPADMTCEDNLCITKKQMIMEGEPPTTTPMLNVLPTSQPCPFGTNCVPTHQPCHTGTNCGQSSCPPGVTCPAHNHTPCPNANCEGCHDNGNCDACSNSNCAACPNGLCPNSMCPNGPCPTGMPSATPTGAPFVSNSEFILSRTSFHTSVLIIVKQSAQCCRCQL